MVPCWSSRCHPARIPYLCKTTIYIIEQFSLQRIVKSHSDLMAVSFLTTCSFSVLSLLLPTTYLPFFWVIQDQREKWRSFVRSGCLAWPALHCLATTALWCWNCVLNADWMQENLKVMAAMTSPLCK